MGGGLRRRCVILQAEQPVGAHQLADSALDLLPHHFRPGVYDASLHVLLPQQRRPRRPRDHARQLHQLPPIRHRPHRHHL